MSDDVVITGLGVMSPIGCDEHCFWDSLTLGRSGASPIERFAELQLPRTIACSIVEPVHREPGIGRAASLAIAAARQCVADASLDLRSLDPNRLAVLVGTTMGETEYIEEQLFTPQEEWLSDEHLLRILGGRPGVISGHVQDALGVSACAMDLYGACAAGNMALTLAIQRLRRGECDVVLAGGADGFSLLAFLGFMRLRIMADTVCRPFDEQRDGLWVGEGAAMFVLERESTARARGVRVRARVGGCAMTCETYHPTRPDPNGDGLMRSMRTALKDAELSRNDIDYVCAHGTGTPHNDAVEVQAMDTCLPEGVPFSSIKALTGHTMGAAAAIEAVCCVLSLEHQTIIPTWNLENVLQPCRCEAVKGQPRPARLRNVLNDSAGFGGYNSCVIFSAA